MGTDLGAQRPEIVTGKMVILSTTAKAHYQVSLQDGKITITQ